MDIYIYITYDQIINSEAMDYLGCLCIAVNAIFRLNLLESLIYKGLFIAKHETHRSYCS